MPGAFISRWAAEFPDKPLVISEYGAGAIAGHHLMPPTQFTEEYQSARTTVPAALAAQNGPLSDRIMLAPRCPLSA